MGIQIKKGGGGRKNERGTFNVGTAENQRDESGLKRQGKINQLKNGVVNGQEGEEGKLRSHLKKSYGPWEQRRGKF